MRPILVEDVDETLRNVLNRRALNFVFWRDLLASTVPVAAPFQALPKDMHRTAPCALRIFSIDCAQYLCTCVTHRTLRVDHTNRSNYERKSSLLTASSDMAAQA